MRASCANNWAAGDTCTLAACRVPSVEFPSFRKGFRCPSGSFEQTDTETRPVAGKRAIEACRRFEAVLSFIPDAGEKTCKYTQPRLALIGQAVVRLNGN